MSAAKRRPYLRLIVSALLSLVQSTHAVGEREPVKADSPPSAASSNKKSEAQPAGGAQSALVKAESLTLREQPKSNAKKIDTLTTCEIVTLGKREGEWSEITTAGGDRGWVLAKFLSPNPFITVASDQFNIRRGPGADYEVIMMVTRKNYPFRVIDCSDGWLLVADYEGDIGWISAKLASFDPYVITKEAKGKVRSGGGVGSPVAFTTEKGVLLRVLEEKEGWLRVKHQDGDEGWISAKIVFGWIDTGLPPKAKALQAKQSGQEPAPAPEKPATKPAETAPAKPAAKPPKPAAKSPPPKKPATKAPAGKTPAQKSKPKP